MSQKFEFPQELILGAIKGNYSFENGIKVNGEDYAVMINKNTKNLMVVKNKALHSATARRIAASMINDAQVSQDRFNGQLAKFASYKQLLNGKKFYLGLGVLKLK